ncbi:hypothetical protein A9K55_001065 [Cordyceps militaris]|uniref:Uncharacterized protein n=1 Tax=Cordyceps militaris TaxID=73501 RepID=A0A2H4SU01_CORMI|nr:hypothetical protein A9K55_001065 [Cordyceps militaris]
MKKATDQPLPDDHDSDVPPPPYAAPPYTATDRPPPPSADADPLVEPTIFLLAGQCVHAETSRSPAAYQLSRAVATLTPATEKVTFERLDSTTGSQRPRPRHLYDLRHSPKLPRIGFARADAPPAYYIHAQSPRRALGHVGLARHGSGGGLRAMPVLVTTSRARFAEDAPPVFALTRSGGRARWVAGDGSDETLAIEDAADDQRRLILMKSLRRKEVDALVALWCCSIWQEAAERAEEASKEMKGSSFLRKMNAGRGIYFGTDIY